MDNQLPRLGYRGRYHANGVLWAGSQKHFGWSQRILMVRGGAIAETELLILRGTTRKHFRLMAQVGYGLARTALGVLCLPGAKKYAVLSSNWLKNKHRGNRSTFHNLVTWLKTRFLIRQATG